MTKRINVRQMAAPPAAAHKGPFEFPRDDRGNVDHLHKHPPRGSSRTVNGTLTQRCTPMPERPSGPTGGDLRARAGRPEIALPVRAPVDNRRCR